MSKCLEIARNLRLCSGAIEYESRIKELTAEKKALQNIIDVLRNEILAIHRNLIEKP